MTRSEFYERKSAQRQAFYEQKAKERAAARAELQRRQKKSKAARSVDRWGSSIKRIGFLSCDKVIAILLALFLVKTMFGMYSDGQIFTPVMGYIGIPGTPVAADRYIGMYATLDEDGKTTYKARYISLSTVVEELSEIQPKGDSFIEYGYSAVSQWSEFFFGDTYYGDDYQEPDYESGEYLLNTVSMKIHIWWDGVIGRDCTKKVEGRELKDLVMEYNDAFLVHVGYELADIRAARGGVVA